VREGWTAPGTVTVTLQRNESVVVIKDVPAEVCDDCGEYYLDEAVTKRIYALAEEAVGRHAEVEVLRYAASFSNAANTACDSGLRKRSTRLWPPAPCVPGVARCFGPL
jgi:YgiT-type zinc finger domain-containing protein